jgi:hypothetical protein
LNRWVFARIVSSLALAVDAGIGLILRECAGFAFVALRVPGSVRFVDGVPVMCTNDANHYLPGFDIAGALFGGVSGGLVAGWLSSRLLRAR